MRINSISALGDFSIAQIEFIMSSIERETEEYNRNIEIIEANKRLDDLEKSVFGGL